jgi:hypothetical protein
MKPRSSFGFVVVVAAIVIAGGVGLAFQWLQTMTLRSELEAARAEVAELARLRVENVRLRAQQISPAQLEALRADHAALPQLRAQVEALNKSTAP